MKYQIIRGDNFGRDDMQELVVLYNVEKEAGEEACAALNRCTPMDGPYFFRLEPTAYVPCKGFEP